MKEIDFKIRAQEHELGINKALDLLSFKCGLGTGRYKFENGTAKTATEVISEKSDLFQSLKKHEIMLESAIKGLVNAISYLLGGKPTDVTIDFDDSIIEDKTSERRSIHLTSKARKAGYARCFDWSNAAVGISHEILRRR